MGVYDMEHGDTGPEIFSFPWGLGTHDEIKLDHENGPARTNISTKP